MFRLGPKNDQDDTGQTSGYWVVRFGMELGGWVLGRLDLILTTYLVAIADITFHTITHQLSTKIILIFIPIETNVM